MKPLHSGLFPARKRLPSAATPADGEVTRQERVDEMLGLAGVSPQARGPQWEAQVRAHCEATVSAVRRGHVLPPDTADALHALLRAWGAGERYPELVQPRR